MDIPIYQVDAFANRVFRGNPAAVCVLEDWLPDDVLQSIAAENNLSETAFVIPRGDAYPLRWFTPTLEVDLCGHATLATGSVIFRIEPDRENITFDSKSGHLAVQRNGDLLALDFPVNPPELCMPPEDLLDGLRCPVPIEVLRDRLYYLVEVEDEAAVRGIDPKLERFLELDRHGVIVTARGDEVDFVSRFFGPQVGVDEDPVTGSAHCSLVPHWATKLEKTTLHARQLSARGGELFCEYRGDRVSIAGHVAPYLEGTIHV